MNEKRPAEAQRTQSKITEKGIFLCVLTLCSLCLCGSFLRAAEPEIDRYDIGQRLILIEKAWDAHPDAAARARALPVLKLAVPQFFSGKTAEAAATLDRSRLLLQSAEPNAAEAWAASLLVHVDKRFLDPAGKPLVVQVVPAYSAGETPTGATARFSLMSADGAARFSAAEVPVAKLPIETMLAVDKAPEGDHTLRVDVVVADKVLATYTTGISVAPNLEERITRVTNAVWTLFPKAIADSTAGKTFFEMSRVLKSLTARSSPETNYPAARLLAEAEMLLKAEIAGERFYGPKRAGQFWLTLPTAFNDTSVRLLVPDAAKAGKPMPLVVALHGAGGSENMFFDAYGYGMIARLAQERGWMVVAPRAGWLFDRPPPVAAIVDELSKLYPVDRQRVYLVGHSMGAMQTVALAQETPGRFAAIAALGGGGSVTKPDAVKDLPVFIGYGSDDFLAGGAKGLAKALKKSRVTLKEYPGVEHILIVQEALPDVFRFFQSKQK